MFVLAPLQNANNLAYYAAYLPLTVESNLRPITENTPVIFQNCINMIPTKEESKFDEIYSRCKEEIETKPTTTTTTPEPTTEIATEDPEEGSGFELSESYILV